MRVLRICSFRLFSSLSSKIISFYSGYLSLLFVLTIHTSVCAKELSLAQTLCANKIPDSELLWKQAYFSTDLSFTQIQLAAPLKDAKLEQFSRNLLRKNFHNSYDLIKCSNELAWLITSPLPEHAISKKNDRLEVFPSTIGSYCRGLSLDFADKSNARTLNLFKTSSLGVSSKPISIYLGKLAEGFLSVTCLPKQKTLGPILWALIPTREVSNLVETSDFGISEQAIFDWINEKRRQVGLKSLSLASGSLLNASRQLAVNSSTVHHDRTLLKQLKNELLTSSFLKIVGENRVRSHDLLKMKWLLWYSPRHRELLLDREASQVALSSQKQHDGSTLLVLLFARKIERNP